MTDSVGTMIAKALRDGGAVVNENSSTADELQLNPYGDMTGVPLPLLPEETMQVIVDGASYYIGIWRGARSSP